MGALTGATAARPGGIPSHELGGGVGAGAKASEEYFQRRDLMNREKAQQNLQNVRQGRQLSREEAESAARVAQWNATTEHERQQLKFEAESHPLVLKHQQQENEETALRLQSTNLAMREAQFSFMKALAEEGINPTDVVTSWAQAAPHVADIARGKTVALHNGKSGADQTVSMFSADDFNRPLTHDVMFSTYKQDAKGNLVEEKHTIKAGDGTVSDYVSAVMNGKAQLNKIFGIQKVEGEHELQAAQTANQRAEAGFHGAQAALTRAETDQIKSFGGVIPPGAAAPADAFKMSPEQLGQQLTLQGVQPPRNFEALYGVAHYDVDPNTFPARTYNKPGQVPQMDKATATSFIRQFINPGWDEKNYAATKDLEKQFADTRRGTAGGNLIAFNAATGHLGQLYDAGLALQNHNVQALNAIANSLSAQFGKPVKPNYEAIREALVGEIGQLMNQAAPNVQETQNIRNTLSTASSPDQVKGAARMYADIMMTKGGAQIQHYYDYTGRLPRSMFSPQAIAVYQKMGIDLNSILPAGATRPPDFAGGQTGPPLTTPVRGVFQNRPIVVDPSLNKWVFEGTKDLVPGQQ